MSEGPAARSLAVVRREWADGRSRSQGRATGPDLEDAPRTVEGRRSRPIRTEDPPHVIVSAS